MSTQEPIVGQKRSLNDRLLGGMEAIGNKLPQPFNLFLILFLIVGLLSTAMAWANVTIQVPGAEDVTRIRGLFTGEGMAWFTSNLGANYIGFPPLVTVMPILLAIGIAEKSGFLGSAIRAAIGAAPRWVLPYAVGLVGVVGSIMADSVFIVVPPLAAMAFKAVGRHPVAGLLGGFAAAGAGYSTSLFPTSLDALFAGITNAVLPTVPTVQAVADPVNPMSNYFYNVVASILLSLLAGFIIDKVIEPRLVREGVPTEEHRIDDEESVISIGGDDGVMEAEEVDINAHGTAQISDAERRGIRAGGLALLITAVIVLAALLIPNSPWRNEDGGFLPRSPLLSSIVFLVFLAFAISGYVYGKVAGTIKNFNDVPRLMGEAIRDMVPFLVLAFMMGQFIALFNWSGIGSWIAVTGANGLEAAGFTGFGVILMFVLLCSFLNLFIISGSAMWTIMEAVFVPMFGLLGYQPAFVQAAFRIGDSATQVITPMNPYMIVLLTFLRRYEPKAGFGTLMARMMPFVIPFWLLWAAILFIFFTFEIPLGPGNTIFLPE